VSMFIATLNTVLVPRPADAAMGVIGAD
jgi:hypothetical protein